MPLLGQGGLVERHFPHSLTKEDLHRDVYTTDRRRQSGRTRYGQRVTMTETSQPSDHRGDPDRTPPATAADASQPPGHRGGRERTRSSRWGPLQGIVRGE
ncbi:hypothetical protein Y032_0555g3371 [Ancylostoma ceylanicum]|uniref:Uncharacterized protein n=1 Tax=Ancylostoma ceylanicum TaxID=53326 RepID=A0A016WQ68_9BILA|nr:hypothetical protein Y032_0555g3371 [Ancylostoma ceylanicum]